MSVHALYLVLLGATVEYRAEFRTVPPEFPEQARELIERRLGERGLVVVLVDPGQNSASGITDRLEVEVVGAVTVARVLLRRVRTSPTDSSPEVVQLERDLPWPTWRDSLSALLEELYPKVERPTPPAVEPDPPPLSASPAVVGEPTPTVQRPGWPLWIVGAGAVALGAGFGFGLKSHLTVRGVESESNFDPEGAMALRRAGNEATAANVLLVSGGLIVTGGLLLYVLGGD